MTWVSLRRGGMNHNIRSSLLTVRAWLVKGTCACGVMLVVGCSFYPSNKSVGIPFCAAGEGEIYELVVYRIAAGDSEQLNKARSNLRSSLGRYAGFRCALPLHSLEDSSLSADLTVWRSVEDAHAAAQSIATDVEFFPLYGANRETRFSGFFSKTP